MGNLFFYRPKSYKNEKIILLILVICSSLEACESQQQKVFSISKIKKLLRANSLTGISNDSDIYVEGFYYKDPVPILVTDLKYTKTNSIMPDSVFLILPNANNFNNKLQPLQGQRIRIKGTIRRIKGEVSNQINKLQFIIKDFKSVIEKAKASSLWPKNIQLSNHLSRATQLQVPKSSNYALLYSGGYDQVHAHIRYWNDLKLMYQTLKLVYGYADDHIVVVYKAGTGEDRQMPVNYPASQAGLESAFNFLTLRSSNKSNLFIFFTNHGGGYNISENANAGGVEDISKDEIDPYNLDEVTYYYNQKTNMILDDQIAASINKIKFNILIAVIEPCFSGGFLRDLRGKNRIIISAASEFEYSYSNSTNDYDAFSYLFTNALGANTADANKDGKVSVLEAFLYARSHDQTGESPGLEDNGDGVSMINPSVSSSGDGLLASKTFLF